jgi:indole-3-glycerol phosphate synthase
MPNRLDQIVNATRARVASAKRSADLRALERRAESHAPRGFRRVLEEQASRGLAVIAELKKASPSKGLIRAEFDAATLAREMAGGGAAALSVLTDEEFFQGSLENLQAASEATKLACLRKDFIVDEFQLLEARAYSADAVLLIAAALESETLVALAKRALGFGLDVLCEAHEEEEVERALDAGCTMVGVNSRDLKTFQVDLNTALRLAKRLPTGVLRVAESGIHSGGDLMRLREAGYDAFLIGETLMREPSPGKALRELLESAATAKA